MASRLKGVIDTLCIRSWVGSRDVFARHSELVLIALGVTLLYFGSSELAYAGKGTFGEACNKILQLVEGTFGALVCAVAGIAAIVAAAMGGFKMAWTLVVVSVGSFILRSYVELFNGVCG